MLTFFQLSKFIGVSVLIEWTENKDCLALISAVCKATRGIISNWIDEFRVQFQRKLFSASQKYYFSNKFAQWITKWQFDVSNCCIVVEDLPVAECPLLIKKLAIRSRRADLTYFRSLSSMLGSIEEISMGPLPPNVVNVLCSRSSLQVVKVLTGDNEDTEPSVATVARICPNLTDLQFDFDLTESALLTITIYARKLKRFILTSSHAYHSARVSTRFLMHTKAPFINLSVSRLTDVPARWISLQFPALKHLTIHNSRDSAVVQAVKSSFNRLVELNVQYTMPGLACWVSDLFSELPNLTCLEYRAGSVRQDCSLEHIGQCPLLRKLVLTVAFKVEMTGVNSIGHLHQLEVLYLRSIILMDKNLIAIAEGCRLLKCVSVIGNKALTDVGFSALAEYCSGLLEANISACSLGDVGLSAIAKYCLNLRILVVNRNALLTDRGVTRCFDLPTLLYLTAETIPSLSGAMVIKLREFLDKNRFKFYRYEETKVDRGFVYKY